MKEYMKYRRLYSFAKIDLKGMGRWIIAAIVLGGIAARMGMQRNGDTTETTLCIMPFLICIALYGYVYNVLTNPPQITREFPFTSKQEIKMSIYLMLENFILLGVVLFVTMIVFGALSGERPNFDINYGETLRRGAFSFFYYLFMAALMYPLGMVKNKKKWYLAFAGISIVIALVTFVFINLIPGKGSYRTSAMVFRNVTKMNNYNIVLGIMAVAAVAAVIFSYRLASKLHAVKKYDE